jgi:hypothetical protein
MSFRTTLFGNIIQSIATITNIEGDIVDMPFSSNDKIKASIETVFNLNQDYPVYDLGLLGFYQSSTIAGNTPSENSICG